MKGSPDVRVIIFAATVLFLEIGSDGLPTSGRHLIAQQTRQNNDPLPTSASPGRMESVAQKKVSLNRKTVNTNELYRALLKDWDRFLAIRRQQPENRKALQRELERLNQQLAILHDSVEPQPAQPDCRVKSANSDERPMPTGEDSSVHPVGPIRSVHTPPAEKDVERFLEALERTHLPGRPLTAEPLETKELSHVPPQWIVQITDMATAEVGTVSRMLKQPTVDEHQIQRDIHRLDLLLRRIDNPPPKTPPTTPKAL